MKNSKSALIFLTYGILIYQFSVEKSYSVFVFLFVLLAELAFLIISYLVAGLLFDKKSKVNYKNVFIGAIPLFLFNYFIIYFATLEVDGFIETYGKSPHGVFYPIIIYQEQIILLISGIVISYFFAFYEVRKKGGKLDYLQSIVIYQALAIWILGSITILVMTNVSKEYYPIAMVILPITRIILELTLVKKQDVNS